MFLTRVAVLVLLATMAQAEFSPEATGRIEVLPESYPDHWVMIHDFSFDHMFEGEVVIIDPLADNVGGQFKGMITASFIASYAHSKKRNEHYVAETFFSRGGRGGTRTDVVTIWNASTLKVADEIVIPAKRITGMPKPITTGLLGEDRFLGVYNFTPGQSVTIVDLEKREVASEIPTSGCGFVIPNGKTSFTSICANGSLMTNHLDQQGKLKASSRTEILFDPEADPIFEAAAISTGIAYFPTFNSRVLPIDISAEEVSAKASWSLTSSEDTGWRPGGLVPVMTDSSGLGYFLMHADGAEGTHKNGGSEVWLFDLAAGRRLSRIVLENWGIALGTSGTGGNQLMFVTNAELGVDVYRIPEGEYVQTLKVALATPFSIHGAH